MLPSKRLALWPGWATSPSRRLKSRLLAYGHQVRAGGLPSLVLALLLALGVVIAGADERLAGLGEHEQLIIAAFVTLEIAIIKQALYRLFDA